MNELENTSIEELEKDLNLRGYDNSEILGLLEIPVLLIPGPVTKGDCGDPIQKLTPQIATMSKALSAKEIKNQVILIKGKPKEYIEERQAHVDLGAMIISLQQLGGLANLAQILDFFLNLIQFGLIQNRTKELTPEARFDLYIRNQKGVIKWQIKAPAGELTKMTTPTRIKAITKALQD